MEKNISEAIENVSDLVYTPVTDVSYVHPFCFNYIQNGKSKTWELVEVHDSVAIILFDTSSKKLIFLKQFRPAVYINSIAKEDRTETPINTEKYPPSLGVSLEVCASVLDSDLTTEDLACEQILTDCGYNVRPHMLKHVMSLRAGADIHGSIQVIFFCEVSDELKTDAGEGLDDELIEKVYMSIEEVEEYIKNPPQEPLPCPPTCLYAMMWFLHNKAKKYKK